MRLKTCPICGAAYEPHPAPLWIAGPWPLIPTCDCLWVRRITIDQTKQIYGGDNTFTTTDVAPAVREQTDREAIETLEQKVDRLTLELARLKRQQEGQ